MLHYFCFRRRKDTFCGRGTRYGTRYKARYERNGSYASRSLYGTGDYTRSNRRTPSRYQSEQLYNTDPYPEPTPTQVSTKYVVTWARYEPGRCPTMLSVKRSATCSTRGGSQEMYIHYIRLCNANKAEPTLALKPRGDVTRNPKQGYQWPQNRTCECVRQKFKKKRKKMYVVTVKTQFTRGWT